jgi:hypothetical protein
VRRDGCCFAIASLGFFDEAESEQVPPMPADAARHVSMLG